MNTWDYMRLYQSNPELFGEERLGDPGTMGGFRDDGRYEGYRAPERLSVTDLLRQGAAAPGRIGALFTALSSGATPTDDAFLKRMYDVVQSPSSEERAWLMGNGRNWWQQYQELKGSGAIEDTGSQGMGRIVNGFANNVLRPLTQAVVGASIGLGATGALGSAAGLTSGQGLFGLGPELGMSGPWAGTAADISGSSGLETLAGGAAADTLGASSAPGFWGMSQGELAALPAAGQLGTDFAIGSSGLSAASVGSTLSALSSGVPFNGLLSGLYDSGLANIPAGSLSYASPGASYDPATSLSNTITGRDALAAGSAASNAADIAGSTGNDTLDNGGNTDVPGVPGLPGGLVDLLRSPTGAGLLNSLLRGGISAWGADRAFDDVSGLANELRDAAQFRPYNVTGPAGGVSFSGDTMTASLSPEMQTTANQYRDLASQYAGDIAGFNTNQYVNNYLNWMRGMSAEYDARNLERLQSRAMNMGMMGSPAGSRLFGEYYRGLNEADLQRQMTAETAGLNRLNTMNTLHNNASTNYRNTLTTPYAWGEMGRQLGQARSLSNVAAAQFPWNLATARAAGTSGMWSNIAQGVGDAVGASMNPNNSSGWRYF